jgi:hypothetical protein
MDCSNNLSAKIKAFAHLKKQGGNSTERKGVFMGFDGETPSCSCDPEAYGQHHQNCPLHDLYTGYNLYQQYAKGAKFA